MVISFDKFYVKTKSDFQEVLERVLENQNPSSRLNKIEDTDWDIDFNFGNELLKVPVFKIAGRSTYKSEMKSIKVEVNAEVKQELKIDIIIEIKIEKPRIERKLTHDQLLSVKIFSKFGEEEISANSNAEEIKSAYHRLAKKFHPDAAQNLDRVSPSDLTFKTIATAYKKLIVGF